MCNVGDSRMYSYSNTSIEQLSEDQTLQYDALKPSSSYSSPTLNSK